MWIKKFLNVNIINFENVDKPEGGGSDNVDKVILLNFNTCIAWVFTSTLCCKFIFGGV